MSETKKRGRKKAYPKIWETVLEQADGDEAKALKQYHRYRALADAQGLDADADVDDVKEPEATEQGQARPRGRPKGSTNKKRGRPKGSASSGAGRRGRPPGRRKQEAAAAADDDGAADSDDEEADEPQLEHKAKKRAVTGRMPEKDLYEQLLAAKEAELRAEREAKEAQRLRAEAEKRRADDLKELAMTYARGQNPKDAAAAAAAAADGDGDGAGEGDGADDAEKQPVDLHKSTSEGQKQSRQFVADNSSVEKRQPDELRTKKKHDKPAGKKSNPPAEEGSTPADTATAQSPAKSARGAKP